MKKFCLLMLLFIVANTVYSQWSKDPNENLQVAVHGGNIHAVPDGKGGAIITFNNFDYEVVTTYLQAIDKSGYLRWNEPKVLIDSPGPENYVEDIFSNNDGTVTIGYISGYYSFDDSLFIPVPHFNPYVQKIDSNGNKLWEAGGVSVKADTTTGYLGVIYCDDGNGGIFAFWGFDYKIQPYGYTDSLYIQHISKNGERLWGDKGIFISDSVFGLNWLINDDNGGFIANYGEELIEKYDSSGILQWSTNVSNRYSSYTPVIKDGAGGVIVSEVTTTLLPRKLLINRISSEGEKLWEEEGIFVDSVGQNYAEALLHLNSDNTVSVFWSTGWYPADDLYLQRYTLNGEQMWESHLKVTDTVSNKYRVGILESENNSNIVVWGDSRNSGGLYAQRIDEFGERIWADSDRVITYRSVSPDVDDEDGIITDGNNGAIIVGQADMPWGPVLAQQISKNGILGEVITSVKEDNNTKHLNFYLAQNYPNPFNQSTAIKFSLPESRNVKLEIINLLGEKVKTLTNEFYNAGNHQIDFNADNLPSGVFFYTISAGNFNETKKMILLK